MYLKLFEIMKYVDRSKDADSTEKRAQLGDDPTPQEGLSSFLAKQGVNGDLDVGDYDH